MHKFLSFDHKIRLASEVFLPAVSSATLYGRGIFTTIAIFDSVSFQWASHWRRLTGNAKIVGIDLAEFTEEAVKSSLSETIDRNDLKTGRARITFFDERAGVVWQSETSRRTSLLIATADFRSLPDSLRVTISPFQINSKSPLAAVKSCNYLENLLVLEEAHARGFDEAIRLNEKTEAATAAMANVFWTRGDEIFTAPTEAGALAGTTRALLLENFNASEKRVSTAELQAADEVFLTSAGIGIARVESLENTVFKQNKVYSKIRRFYDRFRLPDVIKNLGSS